MIFKRNITFAILVMALSLSPVRAEDSMPGMDHGAMQGGSAPPDARDPHAYSDGYDFGPYPLHLADSHNFGGLLVDILEFADNGDATSGNYNLQAWYGKDYDRLVFKAEGVVSDGKLQDASTELLWGHAVATYWNTQLGVRYDSGVDPSRGWLAVGMQGLAPYWFELDGTAYLGESGSSALRLEAEYELLFTQRLILQPRVEANYYGQKDPARGQGAGLSDLSFALRLRYEFRREFAPYIGIVWARKYGTTADYAQADGEDTVETQLVAGVRVWF